ncbi:hypothetical protein E2P63_00465 [Candidatus Bathyarchaeota archaeon]|nr:hypothetical protein E2P63_00465 [Candidatus Bathyarchaeota archaeon]
MWKIRKWFERKSVSKKEYEEEKREFEMAIGRPFITLKIELPEGFDDQRNPFLKLEYDEEFIDEVKDLIKKNLLFKRETAEIITSDDESSENTAKEQ